MGSIPASETPAQSLCCCCDLRDAWAGARGVTGQHGPGRLLEGVEGLFGGCRKCRKPSGLQARLWHLHTEAWSVPGGCHALVCEEDKGVLRETTAAGIALVCPPRTIRFPLPIQKSVSTNVCFTLWTPGWTCIFRSWSPDCLFQTISPLSVVLESKHPHALSVCLFALLFSELHTQTNNKAISSSTIVFLYEKNDKVGE